MVIKYKGVKKIRGTYVAIRGVAPFLEEMVEIELEDDSKRIGRVVQIDGDRAVIQVFQGTDSISLVNTRTRFTGEPIRFTLSPEVLGRVFDGIGRPIDGGGEIFGFVNADINGIPINPVFRTHPRNFIETGISSIDVLTTLVRGQKLPIFSCSGMRHNELAAQIVRQAKIIDDDGSDCAIVFVAMGIKHDVATYFRKEFDKAGTIEKTVMFINILNDPIMERMLAPRYALTTAEYLASERNMHVLVIMTDMMSYAEALREFSSSKGEIPGRKGYPGYMYSDLASLYERAGIIKGQKGSVTQIPILTMPNDDISHPIPDLTGYITEGQIVLDRQLESKGVRPAVSVLPSLSRLMKDGIGEGLTRSDHAVLASQLFASYARAVDVRSLLAVVGEDGLNESDRIYVEFGRIFENKFLKQNSNENRSISESLDLAWKILSILPKSDLAKVDEKTLSEHYIEDKSKLGFYEEKEGKITQGWNSV